MDARNSELPIKAPYIYPIVEGPQVNASQILPTIRREWRLPVLGALIGLTMALCYIALTPTLYKSTARILLDTSMGRYLQASKIVDEPIFDEAQIGSQIYILSSEAIVLPVIRSLNLEQDSEFVGSLDPSPDHSSILETIRKELKRIKSLIGWDSSTQTIDLKTAHEQRAVETFLQHLSVYREDVPNVINVTFSSNDPNKAAEIANAIADTYIASTIETKLKSTKLVGQWLQDRMMDLKGQAAAADQALQDYNIANNLVSSNKGMLNSQQLSDLNAQLASARIALAEAKARLDGTNRSVGDSKRATSSDGSNNPAKVNVTLNNTDIVKLRSELRDTTAKAAELEASFGRNHAVVSKIRKKIDELRASIRDQEQLISDNYANEYEMAKTRESELASVVAKLDGQAKTNSQAQVKMRELESSAETLRTLYNSFLQKYKEINTLQTGSLPIENARIISKAAPPLYKSYKKSAAVLVGSVVLGFLLGGGAAVGKEWIADVFRTPKEVEEWTNIHCVILPKVDPKRMVSRQGGKPTLLEEYVLDAPFSRFTESLRGVKASIGAAQLGEGAKVFGIVSSLPNEGKSTVAANLGALIVASSGARALLIDSDVHLRRLTTELAPHARQGLIEALIEPTRLDSFIIHGSRSNLDLLPCVLPSRVPNAAEILGSPKMEMLIAQARKTYDYVIIEIAPIMSVVDINLIERFVDKFVFVVQWGQTKKSLVLEALTQAGAIRDRILGIVLNKVDPLALRSFEAFKGNRIGGYYQE